MVLAFSIAQDIFREKAGLPCAITSGSDGKHGPNSLHYQGKALDFRTRHLRPDQVHPVFTALKQALGEQYDTVLEEDHIHVEWDVKEQDKLPEDA